MATSMQIPEGDELVTLVRSLARLQGVPCDDPEFPEVVAAYRMFLFAVAALDRIDFPDAIEPAPVYTAAT